MSEVWRPTRQRRTRHGWIPFEETIPLADARQMWGVSVRQADRLIRRGKLQSRRITEVFETRQGRTVRARVYLTPDAVLRGLLLAKGIKPLPGTALAGRRG